jgi:hypothetical protein
MLQLVEDMCLHKMAGQLYSNLQQECDAHISIQLTKLAADQTMDPVLALEKVPDKPPAHTQLLAGGAGSITLAKQRSSNAIHVNPKPARVFYAL